MPEQIILLSIPGLRSQDVQHMPKLTRLVGSGDQANLVPSFPCVTWPVQSNMLTGKLADQHGVVANGFYWRDEQRVEMWTAWNDKIQQPQIWDRMHQQSAGLTSAAWFPMLSKGCGADFVCMPAPVHNPDGTESLWCYTKPSELYGELRDQLGHFPLQHFWGPLANIKSTQWIVDSAIHAIGRFQPRFAYVYLPHLDYAAQKLGPDSPAAKQAVEELDQAIGRLAEGLRQVRNTDDTTWLAASEYVITAVDHVAFPNRILREAGLLDVVDKGDGEQIDFATSEAWALVDHQFSHVFVRHSDSEICNRVCSVFSNQVGFAEILLGGQRGKYHMDHPRSGDIVLISEPNSWQAYYWWLEDSKAPSFARTVDIHRKPGYDPVELHFDMATKTIPLDATLIRGSHGVPAVDAARQGVILCSRKNVIERQRIKDTDVANLVLKRFSK